MKFRATFLLLLSAILMQGCGPKNSDGEVVVYAAQDQVYAEPVLREFTRRTGVEVRAVYDSEAVKTVAIANRLLAEQANPLADVYWGNEELRTRQLKARGVFDPELGWRAIGYRSRCLVVNTQRVQLTEAPRDLDDLTNAVWRGRVAMAVPSFGSTSTHFHLLRQMWGEERWSAWFGRMRGNGVKLLEGNSWVVRAVALGTADVGLTDTDDVIAARRNGAPVERTEWHPDFLPLANTVAVVNRGPNRESARRLQEFLDSEWVREALVQAGALEASDTPWGEARELPWDAALNNLEATRRDLEAFQSR